MTQQDSIRPRLVFVGCGGTGVSALVRLFHGLGYSKILGIDGASSQVTDQLIELGLNITIGHGKKEIHATDQIIYSAAAAQSPEVLAGFSFVGQHPKHVRIPMNYFQCLGEISKMFHTIAIAGTHGKTSTTAFASHVLQDHSDRGISILGAGLSQRGGANVARSPKHTEDITTLLDSLFSPKAPRNESLMKKYFLLVEACEYREHFLHLDVDTALITNIELDHADYFETYEKYMHIFLTFCSKVKGDIFVLAQEKGIQELISRSLVNISEVELIQFNFQHILGSHNHKNASLAFALAQMSIHSFQDSKLSNIKIHLEEFQGLRRRGERLGVNTHAIPVITDYAHHPSEITSTLAGLTEQYPDQNITLIFQPHQARRVIEFWSEFVEACRQADTCIIYDIYAAREDLGELLSYAKTIPSIPHEIHSARTFTDIGKLLAKYNYGSYIEDSEEILTYINSITSGVIVLCTAGNLDWVVRKSQVTI